MQWRIPTMRFLLLLLPLVCAVSSSSCLNRTPEQIRSLSKAGIVVVEDKDSQPKYRVIGTTVFNNGMETIHDPGFSFGDHLVARLRERGYPATKSTEIPNKPHIWLFPSYPYGKEGMTGAGVFRRSFLGMGDNNDVHCNYRASFAETKGSARKAQPIHFGNKAYFYESTDVEKQARRWSDFTPEEKRILRDALRTQMDKAADLILKDLGF
jgi:hypothetical protein